MNAFVYILECADGSLYTGWTDNPVARLEAHNNKSGAKYTRSRTPVSLVYLEQCEDKRAALRREAKIKKLTRTQKLALIEANKNAPQ